jgi:L-threonylcarbamoyladenylate synthase
MDEQARKTQYWKVDAGRPDSEIISRAGLILRRGGLVAFPTETVYGLGANALDGGAVRRIFAAKGRPLDNPLIVHLDSGDYVDDVAAGISPLAEALMQKFWPGPLTLVLPGAGALPVEVTAGLDTVAVRVPDHAVALSLIRAAGVPVAAPSANTSGRPSPTTAGHVIFDLDGKIDAVLDGGPAGVGVESTVLDVTGKIPVILRPGGVTPEQVKAVAGAVEIDPSVMAAAVDTNDKPRSPGMKYRHYAPGVPLVLVEGNENKTGKMLTELAREHLRRGKRVGIMSISENIPLNGSVELVKLGSRCAPHTLAANLYSALRHLDQAGVDIILAEGTGEEELGLAVMNRLRRAADRIIEV